jgi:hypothetical protein
MLFIATVVGWPLSALGVIVDTINVEAQLSGGGCDQTLHEAPPTSMRDL